MRMTARRLSPELVSLVHHVELNESGWWKKAVGQVVRGLLWRARQPLDVEAIRQAAVSEIGVELSPDILRDQLNSLISQHVAIEVPGSGFKLTERAWQDLSLTHEKAAEEASECEDLFLGAVRKECPELDPADVWGKFHAALVGALRVGGANFFNLLTGNDLEREDDWTLAFLRGFPDDSHAGLRGVMTAFFDPGNVSCRKHALRLMTAHFFAEAAHLSPETLAMVEGRKATRSIKVALDTNFVFSVLGLHDNPADDAVSSLMKLAKSGGALLQVKLYVLPSTIDEAQRSLVHQMHMVENIRTTPSISRAALGQAMPSIARKFFEASSKSAGLSAEAYFAPYLKDLRTILRDHGIEILDAHPQIYGKRQDVVDDVLDEQKREQEEVSESKRKGYEALLHDVILWHAVNDRRPMRSDTPFDVEYWVVSIDWRLIGFDRRKLKAAASSVPIVLHPNTLMQLLQFWVPRSKELEDGLIDSLRLPLFFQSFDPEDERATIRVLTTLSRFENVGDLPEATVRSVLANRALRAKLVDARTTDEEAVEFIEGEIFGEHQQAVFNLEQTERRLEAAEAKLLSERESLNLNQRSLEEMGRDLAESGARSKELEAKLSKAQQSWQTESAIQKAQLEQVISERNALYRGIYVVIMIIVPFLIAVFLAMQIHNWLPQSTSASDGFGKWLVVITAMSVPLAIAFSISPVITRKFSCLGEWWLPQLINSVGLKAIWAPLVLAGGAIFQGSILEWFQVFSSTQQ